MPVDPQECFQQLIAMVVAPALKAEGFAKNGLTFLRRRADLIDVVNVQGSDRNGLPDRHAFFLNVAVLSTTVCATLGIEVAARPTETDGLLRRRATEISGSGVDRIDIVGTTDPGALARFVRGELSAVFAFLRALGTTADLMQEVVERNGAAQSTEIAGYLCRVGDEALLLRYLSTLSDRMSGRANWSVLATRLRMAMGDLAPAPALALLPPEVVPWAAPPSWLA